MTTTTDALLKFDATTLDAAEIPTSTAADVPPHVHLFGTPTIGFLPLAGSEEGTGFVAIWTCDRDGFDYEPIPEAEAAFVIDGLLRLTPAGGSSVDVRAGEGYRLPIGWFGRVEAIEPVRKVYFLI